MADHHEDLWLELGRELEEKPDEREEREEAGRPPPMRGAQEFALWMHNPITDAFFAYLADSEASLKDLVLELFIYGQIKDGEGHPDRNPDVQRGRLLALRDLQRISLGGIAGFYREKRAREVSE